MEQVGAGVVMFKKSGWLQSMQQVGLKKAFSDRWKVDQQAQRVITPDVIVNEGGSGTEKSSVEGKEASVAGGGACQRGQPAHLGHHHHDHCQVARGNDHREWCEKGQEQYPDLGNKTYSIP